MTHPFVTHETPGQYQLQRPVTDDEIVNMARQLIAERFQRGHAIHCPTDTHDYLMLELATLEREVFFCLYLDNQHQLLIAETCFLGTVDGASVHPREIVKRALSLNACALIVAHNHPSGKPEPSQADRQITQKLKDALALVEVRVLDHLVIGGTQYFSFAEHGWL